MNFINPDYYNEIEFQVTLVNAETQTVQSIENVVTKVLYKVVATYNNKTEFSEHEVYFPVDTVNLDNITDFNNLSEEQVMSWINPFIPLEALKHSLSLRFKETQASEIKTFAFLGENNE